MSIDAAELDVPVLAGARKPPPPVLSRLLPRGGAEAFSGLPPAAYTQAVVTTLSPLGPITWLNDPAAIKHVLVDQAANYPRTELERSFLASVFGEGLLGSEGELWRSHRKIMAPSFDPRSVASYAPAMAGAAETFTERWSALGAGAPIDAAAEMTALTLQIIALTMFSTESDSFAGLVDDTVSRARAVISGSLLDLLPVTSVIRRRQRERTMRRIFADLDGALEQLIAEREAALADAPRDLLTRLIAAKDAESGFRMTAREVRDEVVTIFLAGHETTAAAMTWIWYLLAKHPAQSAKLRAELDEVLGGRAPSADDVPQLRYTRMVVEESLRLYPSAPGLSQRQAKAADRIGGAKIPTGRIVQVMPWLLHRNPALWPDPERFDPERFSSERSAGRPRFAYLPFGGGPRVCIGASLATTEIILILASLAQRFRLELASDAPVQLLHQVTLRPVGGLPMILQPRSPGE